MTEPLPDAPKRPMAVTLIGGLLILICVLYLVQGVAGLSSSDVIRNALANVFNSPGVLSLPAQTALQNVLDLVRGVVALLLLVGFFRMRRWAWVAVMVWSALGLLRQLFRVSVGDPAYLLMLLEVITIFALNQADLQKIFGVKREDNDTLTASLNSVDRQ